MYRFATSQRSAIINNSAERCQYENIAMLQTDQQMALVLKVGTIWLIRRTQRPHLLSLLSKCFQKPSPTKNFGPLEFALFNKKSTPMVLPDKDNVSAQLEMLLLKL